MNQQKEISKEDVKRVLGIKNNSKITISIKHVGEDRYRVNVYEKYYVDGSVIPRSRIKSSHFLCNRDELKDITL